MSETTQDMILQDRLPLPVHLRRVGDAERSASCEVLSEHFASGRLTEDELEERLGRAVRAVTDDELRRLVVDLPRTEAIAPPPTARAASGRSWPALTVVAVVALIVSAVLAGGMLLVLGAVNPLLFIGACLGGCAAVVVGASGTYLLHRLEPPRFR